MRDRDGEAKSERGERGRETVRVEAEREEQDGVRPKRGVKGEGVKKREEEEEETEEETETERVRRINTERGGRGADLGAGVSMFSAVRGSSRKPTRRKGALTTTTATTAATQEREKEKREGDTQKDRERGDGKEKEAAGTERKVNVTRHHSYASALSSPSRLSPAPPSLSPGPPLTRRQVGIVTYSGGSKRSSGWV